MRACVSGGWSLGPSAADEVQAVTPRQLPPLRLQLIIDDMPLHLRVGSINVEGHLRIGGPSCRAQSPVTITFEAVPGLDPFDLGIKVRARSSRFGLACPPHHMTVAR